MKKLFALSALILTFSINAQTENKQQPTKEKYDKIITVIIKDFSESCGEDPGDAIFCLTDDKGVKITERYMCDMQASVWQIEPKDLITENWVLNSKYKDKKAILYCSKGAGWVVKKVELIK